jgi:hypothetical protein
MRCRLADVPLQREQYAEKQTPALEALHFHTEVRKQSDEPLHALQEVRYDPDSCSQGSLSMDSSWTASKQSASLSVHVSSGLPRSALCPHQPIVARSLPHAVVRLDRFAPNRYQNPLVTLSLIFVIVIYTPTSVNAGGSGPLTTPERTVSGDYRMSLHSPTTDRQLKSPQSLDR